MINTIALNDALSIMKNGSDFQLKFVTADVSRKSGGDEVELSKAVLVGSKNNQKNNDMITVRQVINNDHPYAVHIHLITEFNKQKVFI